MLIATKTNEPSKPVNIDLSGLLHHTLIVGQSGSGKSFFVARLIEEIVLATQARVMVIDPNGDFRELSNVSTGAFHETSLGPRFTELAVASQRDPNYDQATLFQKEWGERRFLNLHPNLIEGTDRENVLHRKLVVHWDALDEEDRDFLLRSDGRVDARSLLGLEAAVQFAKFLASRYSWYGNDLRGLINAAEQFALRNTSLREYEYAKSLDVDDWYAVRARLSELLGRYTVWSSVTHENTVRPLGLTDYIDGPFEGVAQQTERWWDVLTIALDAARHSDSLLVANTALSRLWRDAKAAWRQSTRGVSSDRRVPTFVVIDEAQNFAPAHTDNPLRRRVTGQLLRIASEGRKYGVYLVLATQRPTKLHPELVAECENSCVLRVQSKLETEFASNVLGLDASPAPTFVRGQGLISGRWVDNQVAVNARFAPARTVVGGGGLPQSWRNRVGASPPFSEKSMSLLIKAELENAPEAISLAELADTVRSEFPEIDDRTWEGQGSFKALLRSLEIPELRVSSNAPGYAYLEGRHKSPIGSAPIQRLAGVDKDLVSALQQIHEEIDIPLLDQETYAAIFTSISEVLAHGPFNLTETSKAVRDAVVHNGFRAGRGQVSYIIKGISWSGHQYDSDLPQDPRTLALAFARQLTRSLEEMTNVEGEILLDAISYCTGRLVSLEEIRALRSAFSQTRPKDPLGGQLGGDS